MNVYIDENLRGILKRKENVHFFKNREDLKISSLGSPFLIIFYIENDKFNFNSLKTLKRE